MLLLVSEKPLSQSQLSERYPGYHAEIPLLEYHVKIAGIRSMVQFQEKLETATKQVKMFTLINKQEYTTKIKALNEVGDWLINDARVLWFYDEFKKLVGDCQTVIIKSEDNDRFNEFALSVVGKGKDVTILNSTEKEGEVTAEELIGNSK